MQNMAAELSCQAILTRRASKEAAALAGAAG